MPFCAFANQEYTYLNMRFFVLFVFLQPPKQNPSRSGRTFRQQLIWSWGWAKAQTFQKKTFKYVHSCFAKAQKAQQRLNMCVRDSHVNFLCIL